MSSYDVITIGDAKLDTFLTLTNVHDKVRLDETTHELCFKHGEKISVEHTYFSLGGNAANVAVGLSRLGLKTAIAAEIGDDEFALKIVNVLARENIDRAFVKQSHGQESSMSVIINFKNDRTIFSEHVKREHNFHYLDTQSTWVYLTSLGEEWTQPYEKAIRYIHEKHAKLAFNPGTLQLAKKYDVIQQALQITNLLFINKEEAEQLVKEYSSDTPSDDMGELLHQTHSLGPQVVVITNGRYGAYSLFDDKLYHQAAVASDIVERTGAGDSFASGTLAAIIHNIPIQQALSWGALNSASVVSMVGAQAGLLKKSAMDERIKKL